MAERQGDRANNVSDALIPSVHFTGPRPVTVVIEYRHRHPRKDNKTITVQEHTKDAQGAEHDQTMVYVRSKKGSGSLRRYPLL